MDIPSLLKELPSMEYEFEVDIPGNTTKLQYKGKFKYSIPTLGKQCKISVMEARLNGGVDGVDPVTRLTHYMISYLRYNLDEKSMPEWWVKADYGSNLYDPNVVTDIYQLCVKFEKDWEAKVNGDSEA